MLSRQERLIKGRIYDIRTQQRQLKRNPEGFQKYQHLEMCLSVLNAQLNNRIENFQVIQKNL